MSILRPAATVLLIRPASTPSGMEVFMLKRHRRMGFLPNAWVFPGGRVDAGDAIGARLGDAGGFDDLAFRVAALRETFEESGIWLGTGAPPQSLRDPLNRGEISLEQVLDDTGAIPDVTQLQPWSWWITPEAEPKRYDTRFYVAACEDDGVHDQTENVDSRWVCPRWAVETATVLDFPMAPPTWWTLVELADAGSVDAVFDTASRRPILPIQPVLRFFEDGMQLLLPGHPEHPDTAIEGLPVEVGYSKGRWVAISS